VKQVLLVDVARVVSGGTPKTSVPEFWDGGILWATPKDLSGLKTVEIATTPRKISHAGLKASSAEVLPANSVLFSSRAPIGLIAVNSVPMATNQGFKSFVPKPQHLEARYLYRWLEWKREWLQSLGVGATFKEVSKATVSRISIPLPPLDEQRRIAAILDKADDLRTKRREALAHLETLTQSIFHSMFDDPTSAPHQRALGQVLASIDSGSSPVAADRPASPDEWGILKLSAVTSQTFVATENKALLETAPDARHEVRPGDVLFTRKNTPKLVGAVAIVRQTRPKLLLPDLIFRLNIADRNSLKPEYLQAVLAYPTKRASIQRLAGGAAASMSNISKAKLLAVTVPVPPMELQQTFATRIAAVERLKDLQRKHLAELDTLFASLQNRAFKGEL